MPPHLHPRSRMTSSLFATTVAVSFFVVALPHILPCPAPRVTYADSAQAGANATTVVIVEHHDDGTTTTTTRQRRRRKPIACPEHEENVARVEALNEKNATPPTRRNLGEDGEMTVRTRDRECPVPKPGGVLGELLSYVSSKKSGTETGDQQQKSPRTTTSQPVETSTSES